MAKNLYQEARDALFKNATEQVKRLRKQATKEERIRARREWKENNERTRPPNRS